MNNMKNFSWSDVKVTLLGKEIDVQPIQYTEDKADFEFEGNIIITANEFDSLLALRESRKKISNFQMKKLFKKFVKNNLNNK